MSSGANVRRATHAGSWYTSNPQKLSSELDSWLSNVPPSVDGKNVPIPGARVIIAPHAGYRYSGPAAAWAYKPLDLSQAKRVFILGPNHQHTYHLTGLAISRNDFFDTPLGRLRADKDTRAELFALKIDESEGHLSRGAKVENLPASHDENEHSLEMHMPYLYKMMSETFDDAKDFPPIIPVTIGSTTHGTECTYGKMLAPYLKDPTSVFIVSSDFCHWGSNFDYFYYMPDASGTGVHLDPRLGRPDGPPLHEGIRRLDEMGMQTIEKGTHRDFFDYLRLTGNTICGRHPIGVVMAAIEYIRETEVGIGANYGKFKFVKYDRSNLVEDMSDFSVSYASAYAVL